MQKTVEGLRQQLLLNQSRQQQVQKPGFFDRALQMISFLSGVASTLSKCSVMLEFLSYQHPVNCNLQQVNHLKVM